MTNTVIPNNSTVLDLDGRLYQTTGRSKLCEFCAPGKLHEAVWSEGTLSVVKWFCGRVLTWSELQRQYYVMPGDTTNRHNAGVWTMGDTGNGEYDDNTLDPEDPYHPYVPSSPFEAMWEAMFGVGALPGHVPPEILERFSNRSPNSQSVPSVRVIPPSPELVEFDAGDTRLADEMFSDKVTRWIDESTTPTALKQAKAQRRY